MRLKNLIKSFSRRKQSPQEKEKEYLFNNFHFAEPAKKASPTFITGVGRSGTHFLAELLNQSETIEALHLDDVGNSVGDSFLMFAKWNKLAMDFQPFYSSRDYLIKRSTTNGKAFIESNPYLAFSVKDLADYYPLAKFLVVVRDPRKVVLSHYNKGWYENFIPNRDNLSLPPFYDYRYERANHFFGRIFPKEQTEYKEWCELTTVGKITWMWQTINNAVELDLKTLKEDQYRIIVIDNFEYEDYLECMSFLNYSDYINLESFESIRKRKPGKTKRVRYKAWGQKEEKEFQKQISKFKGYPIPGV